MWRHLVSMARCINVKDHFNDILLAGGNQGNQDTGDIPGVDTSTACYTGCSPGASQAVRILQVAPRGTASLLHIQGRGRWLQQQKEEESETSVIKSKQEHIPSHYIRTYRN